MLPRQDEHQDQVDQRVILHAVLLHEAVAPVVLLGGVLASNALGEMSAKEFTDEKDVAEVEEKKHMLAVTKHGWTWIA